jgi:hypothetical protein
VLTSDHGEALGEDGLAGHNYLAEHNLLVPLVVELPDRRGAGRVIDRQVRSVDVAPTILEAAGLSPPTPPDGRSLLALLRDPVGAWPAEAWSYSASSNYGLALRREDGLKYLFNNAAWSPLLGKEALYDLRRDPEERKDLAREKPTSGFRDEAQQRMARDHVGLRMRLANRADARLRGVFQGPWADHARVKSSGQGCSCVHWSPARFVLEPGDEQTLYLESLPAGPLVVEGVLEGSKRRPVAGFREAFDRAKLARPEALVFEDGAWRRRPVGPSDNLTGFVLWVEGPGEPAASAAPADATVREQLRALGYVH